MPHEPLNPPLEQDWPPESTSVKVIRIDEGDMPDVDSDGVAFDESVHPDPDDVVLPDFDGAVEREWVPPHEKVRRQILDHASHHIGQAVDHLREAANWYGIVDRGGIDRDQLIRDIEGFAETIEYRRSL